MKWLLTDAQAQLQAATLAELAPLPPRWKQVCAGDCGQPVVVERVEVEHGHGCRFPRHLRAPGGEWCNASGVVVTVRSVPADTAAPLFPGWPQ